MLDSSDEEEKMVHQPEESKENDQIEETKASEPSVGNALESTQRKSKEVSNQL